MIYLNGSFTHSCEPLSVLLPVCDSQRHAALQCSETNRQNILDFKLNEKEISVRMDAVYLCIVIVTQGASDNK